MGDRYLTGGSGTSEAVAFLATIEAEEAAAARIARALDEAVEPEALAVGFFDLGHGRFEVSAHYAETPSRDSLMALIEAAVGGDAVGELRIDSVAEQDWVVLSQGKRGPVAAGRFLVHGSHDRANVPRRRLAIEIDADRAFGTAHHASTLGCLLALDDLLKRRRPRVVLDLGTGTGVLAIAAAKTLGQRIVASDNDPLAIAIAIENAGKAGVGPLVRTLVAEGLSHQALRTLKPDLVLANLLARALHDLAPQLARSLRPGGIVVMSGLTSDQARAIEARYRAHGFLLEKRIILAGWTTLVATRRNASALYD
jgi:ribosomal protein L11 methyltransferase